LNYRIDVADADVRIILAAEEWAESRYETLLQYDQVRIFSQLRYWWLVDFERPRDS
jgi:hypothetical protein